MRFLGVFCCVAAVAFAGESAVFTSGARLHIDRHELDGDKVRLYIGPGFIDMDAAVVSAFEPDEHVPAAAPAPVAPPPVPVIAVAPPRTPQELADEAAKKYDLPKWLVRAIMAAESNNQPQAVSPKGAIGLMQLMPGTARELSADPNDPAQNVDAGARYLKQLLLRYNGGLWHAAAAYNAGPRPVDRSQNGIPPYRETERYVNRIDKAYRRAHPEPASTESTN